MAPVPSAVARRAVWTFSDQALSSVTNFALAVVVLRTVPTREFGAFTLVMAIYFLALGLCRALAGEPQVVRYSHVHRREWMDAAGSSTGLALVLGGVGAVVILIASSVLGGNLRAALIPLGLLLPGLLVQDAWRFAFFSAGKPAKSFGNSLVWAVSQVVFTFGILHLGYRSAAAFIFAWGLSALLAGMLGSAQANLIPRPQSSWRWLRRHQDLWPRYTAEFMLGSGSAQAVFFGVGMISGLAAVGTLNAARVVLGPFNIVALGAVGFAVPEGIAISRAKREALVPALLGMGALLAVLALALGGAVLLLPDAVGQAITGASWPSVREVMPFMMIFVAATGLTEAARVGLRIAAASKRSLAARAMSAPMVVTGAVVGAVLGDAKGAAMGLAVSHCLGSWIWWRQVNAAEEDARGRGANGNGSEDGHVRQLRAEDRVPTPRDA